MSYSTKSETTGEISFHNDLVRNHPIQYIIDLNGTC